MGNPREAGRLSCLVQAPSRLPSGRMNNASTSTKQNMPASFRRRIGSARKVAGGNLARAEVFDVGETDLPQACVQRAGVKIGNPGFTDCLDSFGSSIVEGARFRR